MEKHSILVIEDNADIRKITRTALEMAGYRALVCSTLREAREALREKPPDLILLDVELPDGSGLDFCREYRAARESGPPVLFLSGRQEKPDVMAGYTAGGIDYIVKPYDMDILLMKVQAMLKLAGERGKPT